MARAAVKAKQQARAQAQPTKSRARGRRRHSGGGNPNQDLFFVRLRRHQKWVYAVLAVVFGISFVLVGVGSGNGGGLDQLYNGIFGGSGGTSISKAQDEIRSNPAKGYQDLALAYEQKGELSSATDALRKYLALKPKDAKTWGTLAGLEMSQGNKLATQYQQAQQVAQAADPSAPFLPGGTLGSAVGQNPAYQDASQTAATRTSLLYQRAIGAFGQAVKDFKSAVKVQPRNTVYLQELATAAQYSGDTKSQLYALRRYLQVDPNAPNKKAIEKQIKALSKQATPTVQSGNGH
jgi:tetratricopeptide (TPR) repeat protein